MVFQWIGGGLRLLEVGFLEAVGIDDQDAVLLQVGDVDLEGGRVHGDEHVYGVARGVNVAGSEMQLVATDAGQGARRGANLGREVRESGDVVAVQGDRIGELTTSDLHAVAGIASEANDCLVDFLGLEPGRYGCFKSSRHGPLTPYCYATISSRICSSSFPQEEDGSIFLDGDGAVSVMERRPTAKSR